MRNAYKYEKTNTIMKTIYPLSLAVLLAGCSSAPAPAPETLFEDVYADPPALLEEQRRMLAAELGAAPRARP